MEWLAGLVFVLVTLALGRLGKIIRLGMLGIAIFHFFASVGGSPSAPVASPTYLTALPDTPVQAASSLRENILDMGEDPLPIPARPDTSVQAPSSPPENILDMDD